MKLVVGLGNPGNKYTNTRHNMGFILIDDYLQCLGLVTNKSKFDGLYIETLINNEKVLFLKPQKFMNLSGEVIKKYMDYYKITITDLLIIHDDLDLPFGKIKLKYKGSSGGHNGLQNIIDNLKTNEFKRIKVGISKNCDNVIDYVLSDFNKEESKEFNKIKEKTRQILNDYFSIDFMTLMNKYNGDSNETHE